MKTHSGFLFGIKIAFPFLIFLFSCQHKPFTTSSKFAEKELTVLKNIAFCKCLKYVAPESDLWENEGSAAGYFETSNVNPEHIGLISENAQEFVNAHDYKSKYNRNLYLMKCLDYYNSQELEKFLKAL